MNFDLEKAIPILERTPGVLKKMLLGIPPEWIHNNEGQDTWSPFDVVGHLIHGEKTDWMVRAKIILESDEKDFQSFDRFAQFEKSRGKTLEELLAQFDKLRKKNIHELKSWGITNDDLFQKGIHPEFGEVSLSQLLATWVAHDFGHIAQVARVMAKQYQEAVGPWARYISILNK